MNVRHTRIILKSRSKVWGTEFGIYDTFPPLQRVENSTSLKGFTNDEELMHSKHLTQCLPRSKHSIILTIIIFKGDRLEVTLERIEKPGQCAGL